MNIYRGIIYDASISNDNDHLVRVLNNKDARKLIDTPHEQFVFNGFGMAFESQYRIPIHAAAELGRLSNIHTLIKYGSSAINTHDQSTKTPLHYASMGGHTDVVDALIGYGASTEVKDSSGNTPLHMAIKFNHYATTKKLIIHNKNIIDIVDYSGHTPLYYALCNNNRNIVKLLKSLGTNVNLKYDKLTNNETALLSEPISEKDIVKTRYDIYFGKPLYVRLLDTLSATEPIQRLYQHRGIVQASSPCICTIH